MVSKIENSGMERGGIVKTTMKMLLMMASVLLANAAVSQESVKLKDIAFASLPGSKFEVRMQFDSPPPEPQGYTIDKPASLVLDFPGVESQLKEKKYPLSFGSAKSASVLGDAGRTRLILKMNELEKYQTKVEGNVFVMVVGDDQVRDSVKKSASLSDRIVGVKSANGNAINSIDFRRGEGGEGKVIVSMADPKVSVNVEDVGGQIVLSFAQTDLPSSLRRKLDVTDFATPVLAVSSDVSGADATISIKPTGEYDYMAYQADNEYVVSVKKLTEKELEDRKEKFSYVGDKLSLNFQDIPVRSVLQLIADFTELNLVASDTVQGKITLRLENVPWDQALDLVLKTKGLDKRQVGNVLMVAPAAEIATREREDLEAHKQLQELAPLHTEFVQVLYANAKDIYKLFESKKGSGKGGDMGATQSFLSERGSAIVDERTNSIILTETDDKIQQFRDLIKRIDIPVRQVSIEARIVKASTDFGKELGVRWGANGIGSASGKDVVFGGGMANIRELVDPDEDVTWETEGGLGTIDDGMLVDLGTGSPAGSIALGIFDGDNSLIGLELSAMESSGSGEIVSQPKVITGDKQKALIKSGQQIAYQEASSSGATTTTFKDAVLKLEVTPQITPDDRIIMDLTVTKDALAGFADEEQTIPTIDTMELTTKVLVDNGQTVVLGGIFETASLEGVTKVPFLGDLPVVGNLFRRTAKSDQRTELLIFITPKLLQDPMASKR